jgi:hypothetical protein
MNLYRVLRIVGLGLFAALVFAACDGDSAELTTTSVLITESSPAVEQGATTSTPLAADQTTTTRVLRGQTVDSHEVVGREADDDGETLYIVIPPGAYTDVDLENFILDLYESETAPWGAEVFDDKAAVDAYLVTSDDRSEEEQLLVEEHHFVSLVNGAVIRFQGPFSDSGEYPIGS